MKNGYECLSPFTMQNEIVQYCGLPLSKLSNESLDIALQSTLYSFGRGYAGALAAEKAKRKYLKPDGYYV